MLTYASYWQVLAAAGPGNYLEHELGGAAGAYTPLTRLLHASYTPLTRLLHASYTPLTRLLHASYTPLKRLMPHVFGQRTTTRGRRTPQPSQTLRSIGNKTPKAQS
jgi:hypothetical protein